MSFYSIVVPSNSSIYQSVFTSLIEFDLLDPEALYKIFIDPQFDLLAVIKGENRMITNKDQAASVLNDMKIYIFLGVVALLVLLAALLGSLLNKYRVQLKRKLVDWKKKMFWNGAAQSVDVVFMELLITIGVQIQLSIRGSEWQTDFDKRSA